MHIFTCINKYILVLCDLLYVTPNEHICTTPYYITLCVCLCVRACVYVSTYGVCMCSKIPQSSHLLETATPWKRPLYQSVYINICIYLISPCNLPAPLISPLYLSKWVATLEELLYVHNTSTRVHTRVCTCECKSKDI